MTIKLLIEYYYSANAADVDPISISVQGEFNIVTIWCQQLLIWCFFGELILNLCFCFMVISESIRSGASSLFQSDVFPLA